MKVTINDLIKELDDARQTAKENGQASAMVASILAKAKLLGLDKADSELNNEPQPVQIIVNVKNARKPDRVC
ncbi:MULTISPECIES: hypothetical protein [Psychrobacter]|uniref:hypothetical protein n=1 Tax=Psychrobacter TaxID=497 RepID=UPI000C34701D|nr:MULTISPECIES: hypothetical protein [Psychrobacter]MBA6244198.1 hypothetical protein [Psychrobacter sp. Urea-trap-18]MBA6285284.1 hypothetical protein [Psychrobacter sp. Urea-trap-16]MBA6319145.1 hypothetical protein [Psychrobacter sp. Urea-trap-20]MBA6333871.1 hypothetical protein [Psychrobacter sp. Urea-trap-19]PKG60258.1 hypothetical protein CXF63_08945 [Psychrobacter sp. Choline-3u-12]